MYLLLSGRRGSNSRPSAWEADALPTELLPQTNFRIDRPPKTSRTECWRRPEFPKRERKIRKAMWAEMDSNHRRRTPADLQSAPFGHSGIRPKELCMMTAGPVFCLSSHLSSPLFHSLLSSFPLPFFSSFSLAPRLAHHR